MFDAQHANTFFVNGSYAPRTPAQPTEVTVLGVDIPTLTTSLRPCLKRLGSCGSGLSLAAPGSSRLVVHPIGTGGVSEADNAPS